MSFLIADHPNQWSWTYSNGAPSATPGTSVTPGASNGEGSATVVATSSNLTEDTHWLEVWVTGGATGTNVKAHLLDIGVDPAGGTSYQWWVEDISVGGSSTAVTGGIRFWLPLFIPAGSAVAVRIQGSNATQGTVNVWVQFHGKPTRPDLVRSYRKAQTLGTISSSCGPTLGTNVGQSGAAGTWVSIGSTTAFCHHYVLLGFAMNDSSTNAQVVFLDLAYGDGSNKVIIVAGLGRSVIGTGEAYTWVHQPCWVAVPSGGQYYVRASTNLATRDGAYNVLITGMG